MALSVPYATRMQNVIDALNLPYTIVEATPADGNCFFHAVMQNIRNDSNYSFRNHLDLREQLVDFVSSNAELRANPVFRDARKVYVQEHKRPLENFEMAWQRLLHEMRQAGTWVADVFILCSAMFLKRNIFITSGQQTRNFPWLAFESNAVMTEWKAPITMAMIPNEHFQAIHVLQSDYRPCLGCGRVYEVILSHLAKSKDCSRFYNTESLKLNAKKRTKQMRQDKQYQNCNLLQEANLCMYSKNMPYACAVDISPSNNSFFAAVNSSLKEKAFPTEQTLREEVVEFISNVDLESKEVILKAKKSGKNSRQALLNRTFSSLYETRSTLIIKW
jgi:hypothetical protein